MIFFPIKKSISNIFSNYMEWIRINFATQNKLYTIETKNCDWLSCSIVFIIRSNFSWHKKKSISIQCHTIPNGFNWNFQSNGPNFISILTNIVQKYLVSYYSDVCCINDANMNVMHSFQYASCLRGNTDRMMCWRI